MNGQEEDNGRKSLEPETAARKCGQNRRRALRDRAYGTGPSPGFYRKRKTTNCDTSASGNFFTSLPVLRSGLRMSAAIRPTLVSPRRVLDDVQRAVSMVVNDRRPV